MPDKQEIKEAEKLLDEMLSRLSEKEMQDARREAYRLGATWVEEDEKRQNSPRAASA